MACGNLREEPLTRTLILSDIHSNGDALDAVLQDSRQKAFDQVWVLGDICGYGPQPRECIEAVKKLPGVRMIMGNHDRVIGKVEQPLGFNPHAIAAAYRNMQQLEESDIRWLADLPNRIEPDPEVLLCHGSPEDPDLYLLSLAAAVPSLHFLKTSSKIMGFFGHTHVPTLYEWDERTSAYNEIDIDFGLPLALDASGGFRYLINPGSVGQPRDGNPMAAYAILSRELQRWEITFFRVGYSVIDCQKKMSHLGYPEMLIKRLGVGF